MSTDANHQSPQHHGFPDRGPPFWRALLSAFCFLMALYFFASGTFITTESAIHQIYGMVCYIGGFLAITVHVLILILNRVE
jgi:hypothetical protein